MTVDPLRYTLAAVALLLALAGSAGIVVAREHVRRLFIAAVTAFSVVTVGGQLANLGRPYTWVTWALACAVGLSVAANVAHLAQRWPDARAGGRRDGR